MSDLETKLRYVIETMDIANAMTEPFINSLKKALEFATFELRAEGGSILIRENDGGDLYFLLATGKVADKLKGMKVPSGKGIAGFVFSSGQPIAVSDVEQEPTFYEEIDKITGYKTQTILAVPLYHGDDIIGVLEFVNRAEDMSYEPFTSAEMDRASLLAEIIASLVNAYESVKAFYNLGQKLFENYDKRDIEEIKNWLYSIRSSKEHSQMIELSLLIRELASQGELEQKLCKDLLNILLKYSKAKQSPF
jgi:signal transduction protein with GAF and PtsI domain